MQPLQFGQKPFIKIMKTEKNFATQSSLAILFALACMFPSQSARAVGLFSSATAADNNSVAPRIDSDILKRRVVHVNFDELASQTRAGAKLDLNLFEDLSLEGTVEQMEKRSPRNYTLSGRVGDDGVSTFALAVIDDVVAMNVRTKGELYQVRFLQNGLHEISKANQNKYPECGNGPEQTVNVPVGAAADGPVQAQGDAGDLIDVMVIYTPAARLAADPNGASNAILAAIDLAVSESNTAYQESQINTRIRLVHVGEVSYTETGGPDGAGFSTDLNHLTNPTDGFLDEVQGLRNTYGADLVSLWIDDASSCGLGWLMGSGSLSTNFASSAFSVVHWDCATGYYSFAHEMAHNMGCQHNREASTTQGLFPYSYGWHFFGTNGTEYRTIMSYQPYGERIQRFSNPNVNYFGTPTGILAGQANQSDNAQTINQSASTVANFRQRVVSTNVAPSITDQPQPQSVAPGGTATFAVTATGTPPLYYFWKRSSTNISGATTSSFSITNVQTSDVTNYSVVVSNAFGFITSSNAALSLNTAVSLGAALDNTGFIWITGGNTEAGEGTVGGPASWVGETGISHDGIDAAESGDIGDLGFSSLQTTIEGPGELTFWWKVSSEEGYDWLELFLDDGLLDPAGISGDQDWSFRKFQIPAGTHTLDWEYSKDITSAEGLDKAWVDQVTYVAGSSFTTSSLRMTNGQFQFVVNGKPGATYSLQASTNLTNWATLTNILSTNFTTLYQDASASSNKMRFYRVTSP